MLAVAGVIAVVVYQKLGVEVLRRAWVNLDVIWVGALVMTGGITLSTRSVAFCRRVIQAFSEEDAPAAPCKQGDGAGRRSASLFFLAPFFGESPALGGSEPLKMSWWRSQNVATD